MDKNLLVNLEDIYRSYSENAYIYPTMGIQKTSNYDPIRQTGKTLTAYQNPHIIKVLLKQVSAYSKTLPSQGITEQDALDIIIKSKDLSLIESAHKIIINGNTYYNLHDSVGRKITYTSIVNGFYKVRLSRKIK